MSSEMWHGGGNASSEADALDARDGVEVSVIAQDCQPVLTRQRRNPNVVLGYRIARLLQFEPNIGIRARGGGSDPSSPVSKSCEPWGRDKPVSSLCNP